MGVRDDLDNCAQYQQPSDHHCSPVGIGRLKLAAIDSIHLRRGGAACNLDQHLCY
ncbi:uncharacterized protein METZ01_LOCUS452613, partial [marine metagenome]